jgi:hypothetical protein
MKFISKCQRKPEKGFRYDRFFHRIISKWTWNRHGYNTIGHSAMKNTSTAVKYSFPFQTGLVVMWKANTIDFFFVFFP